MKVTIEIEARSVPSGDDKYGSQVMSAKKELELESIEDCVELALILLSRAKKYEAEG